MKWSWRMIKLLLVVQVADVSQQCLIHGTSVGIPFNISLFPVCPLKA
jgi:hypothetical protein